MYRLSLPVFRLADSVFAVSLGMATDEQESEWRNSDNWRLGIFYSSDRDDRMFVPKRFGIGWTLNFAHSGSRFLVLIILGLPLAVMYLRRGR